MTGKIAVNKKKFYQPLIKMFGGKGGKQINKWILQHFPGNHTSYHYLEGCIGGGSVLFNKEKTVYREFINDINPTLINLYSEVRDNFDQLFYTLSRVDYTEETFKKALAGNIYSESASFYIKYRMSRAGMGKDFCWSSRLRRGMPEAISAWKTALEQLPELSARLQNVRISNCDINSLLDGRRNKSDLFCYIDLPYVKNTRSKGNIYEYECGDDTHEKMCEIVTAADFLPLILISGYRNDLYEKTLERCGFNRHELTVANHSAQNNTKSKKVECLWSNY